MLFVRVGTYFDPNSKRPLPRRQRTYLFKDLYKETIIIKNPKKLGSLMSRYTRRGPTSYPAKPEPSSPTAWVRDSWLFFSVCLGFL